MFAFLCFIGEIDFYYQELERWKKLKEKKEN